MSEPCRATVPVGCPSHPVTLACHQPSPHPDLNHYDALERIWWQYIPDSEPVLYEEGLAPGPLVTPPLSPRSA